MNMGQQSRFKKHHILLIVGSAVIALVGLFWGGSSPVAKEKPLPPSVQSFVVGSEFSNGFRFTGTVQARVESNLGFRVSGKIIEKLVDEGQRVTKGQPLMRLDPIDISLANQAAQQEVLAARAEHERAILELNRIKELFSLRAASQQEYERAQATADASLAKLQAAEANANRAANEVNYTTLRAETDGVITEVPADVGQVVTAGQVVVRVAKNGTREAVINLPEQYLKEAGNATQAYLYTSPNEMFPVKLRELSAMADEVSRTYQARYTLLGHGKDAPLGSTVTVQFSNTNVKGHDHYKVPLGALYSVGEATHVWVIDEQSMSVSLRKVSVEKLGQEMAGITGDIQPGERIVALGAHLLKSAQKVRLIQNGAGDATK